MPNGAVEQRRRGNYHNSIVSIWQGGVEETAVCRQQPRAAPENLCFKTNRVETISFFDKIRKSFSRSISKKKGGFVYRRTANSIPKISGYFDFSKIEKISMASAVVLAADYERLKHFLNEVPPTINLRRWNPVVVTKLNQMGFFNILGHQPDENLLIQDGDFLLMRILRSVNSANLSQVDDALMELGAFVSDDESAIDEKVTHTLSIVSEVMANVTQHAYRNEVDFTYNHLSSFWVSAEANRAEKTLRIVLYDQGATIPVTYPILDRTKRVTRFLERVLRRAPKFDYEDDGTYIRAALRYGGSRTDLDYRGKGFPQMIQLLGTLGGGELMVLSRGGWCARASNGKVTSGSYPCSIGGTLVEWKIEL
ncbi:hypothetical protein OCA8868_03154 [Octadecabacter ascidiaceicola]|uniref:ATP-binding protein n=2 Tax=Octadecabacter ascidiaceicola TaxID=1655543 RepID=A0A238KPB2_9RHOB|nr:hypothetical protein OCA8868_03154 [Octadecabacter ascidiaceicola]